MFAEEKLLRHNDYATMIIAFIPLPGKRMVCLERGVADAPDIKSCEDKGVAVCRGKQRLITRRIRPVIGPPFFCRFTMW